MILRRFDPKIMDWIIKPSSIKNFISKNFFSVQNIHHVLTENMGTGTIRILAIFAKTTNFRPNCRENRV